MRHVPLTDFEDRFVQLVAAVEAGEEIVITRQGRDVVRLVGMEDERTKIKREAIASLRRIGNRVVARHGSMSDAELRQWIEEDRK